MPNVGTYIYVNGVSQSNYSDSTYSTYVDWQNIVNMEDNTTNSANINMLAGTWPMSYRPQDLYLDSVSSYSTFAAYPLVSVVARVWAYSSPAGGILNIDYQGDEQEIILSDSLAYYDKTLTGLYYGSDLGYLEGSNVYVEENVNRTYYLSLIRYYVTYNTDKHGLLIKNAVGETILDSTVDRISRVVDYREFGAGVFTSYQVDCGPSDMQSNSIKVYTTVIDTGNVIPAKATVSSAVISGRRVATVTLSNMATSKAVNGIVLYTASSGPTGVYVVIQ